MKLKYGDKVIAGIIALLLSVLVIPISVMAQKVRTGIKGGLNVSNLSIGNVSDENIRPGFHVGVFTQLPVSKFFVIQPEVLYSTKGATGYDTDPVDLESEYKFNLNYVDVSVSATFRLREAADIHIGPYVSYLTNASISTDGDLGGGAANLDRDNFSALDYRPSASFQLNFSAVSIGIRYNYGLNQIADLDESELVLGDARDSMTQIYMSLNLA